jgi:hypothetical protein
MDSEAVQCNSSNQSQSFNYLAFSIVCLNFEMMPQNADASVFIVHSDSSLRSAHDLISLPGFLASPRFRHFWTCLSAAFSNSI